MGTQMASLPDDIPQTKTQLHVPPPPQQEQEHTPAPKRWMKPAIGHSSSDPVLIDIAAKGLFFATSIHQLSKKSDASHKGIYNGPAYCAVCDLLSL